MGTISNEDDAPDDVPARLQNNGADDYCASSKFVAELFGSGRTEHNVELRALSNAQGGGCSGTLMCRDMEQIKAFCAWHEGPGHAIYFGAATRRREARSGGRADAMELPALWLDADCLNHGLNPDETRQSLLTCPCPPTKIVDSGGGLHAWWFLREALDVSINDVGENETERQIVAALHKLADVFAGDHNVCDLARIMRLPGTHNTKPKVMATRGNGAPVRVEVIHNGGPVYEFDELAEWLDEQRPLIADPTKPDGDATDGDEGDTPDPLTGHGYAHGYDPKAMIDVEARLAAMTYLAKDDRSIHQTQLHVSAALICQGESDDKIVEVLLEATRKAAGEEGRKWRWKHEEAVIRNMITTWREKLEKKEGPGAGTPKKKRGRPSDHPKYDYETIGKVITSLPDDDHHRAGTIALDLLEQADLAPHEEDVIIKTAAGLAKCTVGSLRASRKQRVRDRERERAEEGGEATGTLVFRP
jgi:hypothetical protein